MLYFLLLIILNFFNMKKFILLSLITLISYQAKADIIIKNNTLCPYVLSIPGYGYFQVPGFYGSWTISPPFASNIKVAIWPGFPNPPIID